jgi:transcriptional regulator with XRE-family HTH domain
MFTGIPMVTNTNEFETIPDEIGLEVLKRFGAAVRRRRVALNLTQEEFSHRAGLHRTYISNVERGERNLTLLTALRISTGLGTSLLELIGESI